MLDGQQRLTSLYQAFTHGGEVRTVHPLVRRHAETGEESIYVSCAHVERMEAPPSDGLPPVWLDEAVLEARQLEELQTEPLVPPLQDDSALDGRQPSRFGCFE